MARKIKGQDYFDQSVHEMIRRIAGDLKGLNTEQQKLISTILKGKGSIEINNKLIKESGKINEKLTASLKEANGIKKRQLSTDAKSAAAKSKENKKLIESKGALQQLNAEVKDTILLQGRSARKINESNASLKQLEAALRINQRAYANMTAAQRANVKVGGKLLGTIKQQDAASKRLSSTMGQSQKKVGSYGQAFRNVQMKMMGVVMAGAAVIRLTSRMIGSFVDFNSSMAKVAAISGASDQELKKLSDSAKELGISTEKSATEVAALQLELSKKGFSPEQINKSTAAILNLSIATGEDLAQSSDIASGLMNAFGLQAADMGRIVDVMASSFSNSALDLEKYKLGMSKVAPVARQLGLSIEQTSGYLGVLVDNNVEAGTASAQLRNILIDLNKRGMTLEQGLTQLSGETDKVAAATDMFGKRAAPIAAILSENIDKAADLTETFEGSAGAAKKMADVMKDTLSGDIKAAKSAVEGLSIKVGESNESGLRGIVQKFTKAIRWLSDNLSTIGTVIKATAAFFVTLAAGIQIAAIVTGEATKATKKFGKALKWLKTVNPYALLAAGIVAATVVIVAFIKEQGKVRKITNEISNGLMTQKQRFNELFDVLETAPKSTDAYKTALSTLNDEFGDYLDYQATDKLNQEQLNILKARGIELMEDEAVKRLQTRLQAEVMDEAYADIAEAQLKMSEKVAESLGQSLVATMATSEKMVNKIKNDTDKISDIYEKGQYTDAASGVTSTKWHVIRDEMTEYFELSERLSTSAAKKILKVAEEYENLERKQIETTSAVNMMRAAFDSVDTDTWVARLPNDMDKFTEASKESIRSFVKQYQEAVNLAETTAEKEKLINKYLEKRSGWLKTLEKIKVDDDDVDDDDDDDVDDGAAAQEEMERNAREFMDKMALMQLSGKDRAVAIAMQKTAELLTVNDEYIKFYQKQVEDGVVGAEKKLKEHNEIEKQIKAQGAATITEIEEAAQKEMERNAREFQDKMSLMQLSDKDRSVVTAMQETAELLTVNDEYIKFYQKRVDEGYRDAEEKLKEHIDIEKQIIEQGKVKVDKIIKPDKTDETDWTDDALKFWDDYGQAGVDSINDIANAFGALSDKRIAEQEAELTAVQADYAARIEAAEGNETEQERLQDELFLKEQDINAKILAEKQKQAKIDKAIAMFNAAIYGEVAIMEAFATPIIGPIIGPIVAAGVAAQIAAIAATPIPQFEKGTDDAPGGQAMVNEKGQEAIVEPDGKVKLYKGRNAIVDLPEHSQVITADKTPEFLRNMVNVQRDDGTKYLGYDYRKTLNQIAKNTAKNNNPDYRVLAYRNKYVN